MRHSTSRLLRFADLVAVFALCAWIGVDLLGTHFFSRRPWPDSVIDYRIIYDYSRQVVTTHEYPAVYPHPPAAVVLESVLSQFPYPVAAGLWLLLTGAAALTCWATLARILGLDRRPGGMVLILLAHAASAYFFQWELRSLNNNLLFLAALLLGAAAMLDGRPRTAGLWLALSISLKLYSVLIVPYLLWTGRRRDFVWTLAALGVFWVLLPAAVFGAAVIDVYAAWFRQLAQAMNAHRDPHPILISLAGSAASLPAGDVVVGIVRGLWIAALIVLAIAARRPAAVADPYRLLSELGLLTLAPIAVSPYLEPYHAVPIAIPAAILASIAADRAFTARGRIAAGLLLALSATMICWPHHWEIRGLVVNAELMLASVGAAVVSALSRADSRLPLPSIVASFRPGRRTASREPLAWAAVSRKMH